MTNILSGGYARRAIVPAPRRAAARADAAHVADGHPAVPRHRLLGGADGRDRGGQHADLHAQMGSGRARWRSSSARRSMSTGGVPTIAWQLLEHPDRAQIRSLQPRGDRLWRRALRARTGQAHPRRIRRAARQWLGHDRDDGDGDAAIRREDYLNRPTSAGPPVAVADLEIMRRRRRRPSCRRARSANCGRAGR